MIFIKKTICIVVFLFSILLVKGQTSFVDSIFNADSLRKIVEVLASDSLKGRLTGSKESLKAAEFIAHEFKKAGLNSIAGNNDFFMEMRPSWVNVVGGIQGRSKSGQVIIFSAHYDHIGTKKNTKTGKTNTDDADSIYNGANDNAAGVASIITLAKYLKSKNDNERTLLFVAFTGEEQGLLGSKHFVEFCNPDSIIAVINIDLIGRSESLKPRPYVTGSERSDLIYILNTNYQAFGNKKEKRYFQPDPYTNQLLFIRSDNLPFAQMGIPAHTIMLTSPHDQYYHSLKDEAWTLDYEQMKNVIRAISFGVNGLVQGIDTPKRIKKF
jgi:Zn-dependent M28 family amino/carboxypeptidase